MQWNEIWWGQVELKGVGAGEKGTLFRTPLDFQSSA